MGEISVIKASAGSGKTYRLVYEYIRTIIDNPLSYKNILAVTFTNKATSEMKSRIIEQLYRLSMGGGDYITDLVNEKNMSEQVVQHRALLALNSILQDYSHFAVMTIDRFFQRIIRAFIHELGVDAGFTLELQTDGLLAQATDSLIENIGSDKRLRQWIIQYVEERISDNKHWDVRNDIRALGRELFKDTRVNLNQDRISNEELLDFVARVAKTSSYIDKTMRAVASAAVRVIEKAGLSLNDFAYTNGSCAAYFYKVKADGAQAFGARIEKGIVEQSTWYSKKSERKDQICELLPILMPLLEQLTQMYTNNLRFLNSATQLKAKFRTYALLNDLSDKIDAICKEQSIVPISDTNSIIHGLISNNDTPFIFEKTGSRFTNYMIDEFQDTSQTQWDNFLPLLNNALAQSEDTPVLLVGDIKQSIYRWRGGHWRILGEQIAERYGRRVKYDNLDTNRRSYGNIVAFNNCLMSSCVQIDSQGLDDKLQQAHDLGFISRQSLEEFSGMLRGAYIDSLQKKFKEPDKGYVTLTRFNEKPDDENEYVINKIIELQDRGYAARDITILVRNNSTGIGIANAILAYKTAHAEDTKHNFSVITGEALLLKNSPVTCFIVAVFHLACWPEKIQAAVYNRFLGRDVSATISDQDNEFISGLRLVSLDEAFENIVMYYELNKHSDNISYLQAIHELVISLSSNKVYDIPCFLNWWEDNKARRSLHLPENNDAINIVTIHKSKGLQYKVVIIPKCRWELDFSATKQPLIWTNGVSPFDSLPKIPMVCNKALSMSYYADDYYSELVLNHVDNINILYVALTRAIAELHICLPYKSVKQRSIDTVIEESMLNNGDGSIVIRDRLQESSECIYGTIETTQTQTTYSFGEKLINKAQEMAINPALAFPVRRPENKLKFKVHSSIEMDGHAASKSSPRQYGILMHKIFENIIDKDQITASLQQMVVSGEISSSDQAMLQEKIDVLLSDPLTHSWFDGNWKELMVERSILTSEGATYRPDRVIVKDDQVIVIDYKFGLLTPKSHARATRNYMNLISGMGYSEVIGYLWYIEQNRIETVKND